MGDEGTWGVPVPDADVESILQLCATRCGVTIAGRRGSGRRILSERIARLVSPALDVRSALSLNKDRAQDFDLLQLLGFARPAPTASPMFVAATLGAESLPRVILVEDIQFADAMSVRVLSMLARQRKALVLATTQDPGHSNIGILGLPVYSVPQLSMEMASHLVAGRLQARPLDRDVRWLDSVCEGSYAALRWLIDTCDANARITITHGVARLEVPRGELPPAWELEPTLTSTMLGRVTALLVEAPLTLLRDMAGSEAIALAEDIGCVTIDAELGVVRLANRVVGLDILFRTGRERRRILVEGILASTASAGLLSPRAAANLVMAAVDLDVVVPPEVGHHAVPELVRRGHPTVARCFEPNSSLVAAEMVLADIWVGDIATARSRFDEWFRTPEHGPQPDVEAAGLALVLGELRFGAELGAGAAVDAAVAALEGSDPEGAEMLRAFRALIRPSASAPDWDSLRHVRPETMTQARLVRALAFWDLFDGRPERALISATRADQVYTGNTVDAHLAAVLHFLIRLSIPDLSAAHRVLPARAPHTPSPTSENLLWAVLAIYDGSPAVALETVSSEIPNLEATFPTALGAVQGAITLCATLVGDRSGARGHHPHAANPSASPLLEAVRLFAGASATAALRRGAGAAEAFALYEQGRVAAEEARVRALVLPNILGQVLLFRRARRRLGDAALPTVPDDELRGFDGVFRIYRELAVAHGAGNFAKVAEITLELHSRGLLLDALGAATTVPANGAEGALPRALERAVARLARRGRAAPIRDSAANELLTDREREIAGLVATGMTDREIAARLHVSARTVSVHVGRILRKLGLASRHQVGGVLDDRG